MSSLSEANDSAELSSGLDLQRRAHLKDQTEQSSHCQRGCLFGLNQKQKIRINVWILEYRPGPCWLVLCGGMGMTDCIISVVSFFIHTKTDFFFF